MPYVITGPLGANGPKNHSCRPTCGPAGRHGVADRLVFPYGPSCLARWSRTVSAMYLTWAVAGAAIGVPVGAIARSTVFQLSVPSGAPDRGACPCCCAPVVPRPALRCGSCGSGFGRPGVLELVTAV